MLAENRFELTKSLFMEGALHSSQDNYRKAAKKIVFFLGLLWLAFLAFVYRTGGSFVPAYFELAVIALVGLWVGVYLPRSKVRLAYKTLENKCGGNMDRCIRFYDDHLEALSAAGSTTVPYAELETVQQTKHLMILTSKEKTGVLVKLDSFMEGSAGLVQTMIEKAKESEP